MMKIRSRCLSLFSSMCVGSRRMGKSAELSFAIDRVLDFHLILEVDLPARLVTSTMSGLYL